MFQGINTEVTVPESSRVLLRFSGASPLSLKALAYILPGITIAKYRSEAVKFKVKQLATVLAKSPNTESNRFS